MNGCCREDDEEGYGPPSIHTASAVACLLFDVLYQRHERGTIRLLSTVNNMVSLGDHYPLLKWSELK